MRLIRPPRSPQDRSVDRSGRVLAIVGNTQVGLWVVRSLGRAGLKVFSVCTSDHGLAAHSRYSSGAWAVEVGAGDPAFPDEVEALARRLDVGSIMTIAESYHLALIRSRDRFEPDIHVFSPPAGCFEKAGDKDYLHALCARLGIPVARGTTLDKLAADGSRCGLHLPLVLRTSRQYDAGGAPVAPWKAAYAENERQLEDLYAQVRDIADNVLVQEHHPGAEDHVQILMRGGQAFMVGEYYGEHHMPLAGGVTVQRVTCRHEKLISDAIKLLQAVEWDGIAGVQFHYDLDADRYIFLEINRRFIGGLPSIIMAGFDAPLLLWQSHFEPDRMRRRRYQLGLRTRILGGDANWMLGTIRGDPLPPGQRRTGRLAAVWQFLWNFGPWTNDDVFALGDIEPFFVDWIQMLRRLGARSFDLVGTPEVWGNRR